MELKLALMRLKLPLLRARYIPPARAPILRYGVAVLSITLALIPALMLADVVESRLVVFAVAIMVSAWYGGWKPGWSRPRLRSPSAPISPWQATTPPPNIAKPSYI